MTESDPRAIFDEALNAHVANPSDLDAYQRVLSLAAEHPDVAARAYEQKLAEAPTTDLAEKGSGGLPPKRPAPATNWGTNVPLGATEARQPKTTQQTASSLAYAVSKGQKARAIGASHSASVVQTTPGVLIDTGTLTSPVSTATNSTLRQCRELSPAAWYKGSATDIAKLAEVGAGCRCQDVIDYLAATHRTLPMTGSYTGQTLVGAFMTSTHGAGVIHAPLHDAVRSIQLLTVNASGHTVEMRIERTQGITNPETYKRDMPHVELIQDDDVFRAVVVSMGCMGVVTSVIIATVPPFFLLQETEITSWQRARGILLDVDPKSRVPLYFKDTYNGGVLLCPYREHLTSGDQKCVLSRTKLQTLPQPGADPPKGSPVSNVLVELARVIGNTAPAFIPLLLNRVVGGTSTKQVWGVGNAVTGSRTELPQGYSAEHGFHLDDIVPAMDEILAEMASLAHKGKVMVGPISLRWVGGCDAFLSMTHGGPRVFAEILTMAHINTSLDVLRLIEPIALRHRSRPHWGQWFSPGMTPNIVRTYPEYAKWNAVRERLDPKGIFHNSFTDELPKLHL